MKKISLRSLRYVLSALFLSCTLFNSYASHIVGADLYYTHIAGNTYRITMVLYGDCGPASAASFSTLPSSTPQICIFSHDTSVTSLSLSIDTPTLGHEIVVCPGDTSQCTSITATMPGVKKFVYSNTYTFPYASTTWRLVYGGDNGSGSTAGRAAAITNLAAPGSSLMQLTDTLNNTVYANSSPDLTVAQQTFFCFNQHDVYNPGAVDPDGDSLSFALVGAMNGTGSCTVGSTVAYTSTPAWPGGASLSAIYPVQVAAADSFSMNEVTGDMFFHPLFQRAAVVYNIREFRGGNLVGTSQREMTILTVICDSASFNCMYVAPPVAPISGVPAVNMVNDAKLYPNPTGDELNIEITSGAYSSFTITNTIGEVLLRQQLNTTQTKINIGAFPAGMYYMILKGQQLNSIQKFVKM